MDAIEAAVTVLSQQTLPNGRIELTTTMQGRVLTAANEGWSFDTRVIFELVTRGGFLRIAKMKEADAELGARGAGEGLEAATWASIKSLYRSAIPTDLTDPAAVIATHARALHERDLFAYQRLLDEEFEFFPLERDVADFPWLDGDSWPKADELLMIGHMFDPNFAGDENPVHQIDVDFTILFQQPLPSGRLQLKTAMQGRILTAANDGWSFDTIAFFELISREGFLRIAKIDEEDAVRAGDVRVEESSWGSIKAIYR